MKSLFIGFVLITCYHWIGVSGESNENATESVINRIEVIVIDRNETSLEANDTNETLITTELPITTTTTTTTPIPKVISTVPTVIKNVTQSVPAIDSDWNRSRDKPKKVLIQVLETNMMDNEVDLCISLVNNTVSHEYGSRKTARLLKTDLDDIFKDQKYRFSVIISANETNIISKRLYGIWISLTANRKHYLLIGSFKALNTNKLSEAQMDRIEDWTAVYFVTYENMTFQSQFDRVTKMTKEKLDLNYGKGNAWAVIAYKHSTTIKAKRFLDGSPQIQFKRIDGSYWLVFRGGEDIPLNNRIKNS